jgi:hypothetical protein
MKGPAAQTSDIPPIFVDAWNQGWDVIRQSIDGHIQRRGSHGVGAKLAGWTLPFG